MASTGFLFPDGGSGGDWNNTGNIDAVDATYAVHNALSGPAATVGDLTGTYSSSPTIPASAVNGVRVRVTHKGTDASTFWLDSITVSSDSGSFSKTLSKSYLTTSDNNNNYGNSTDLWGDTAANLKAILEDNNLQIVLVYKKEAIGIAEFLTVDAVRIKAWYTEVPAINASITDGRETPAADIDVDRTVSGAITDGGETLSGDLSVLVQLNGAITDGGESVAGDAILIVPADINLSAVLTDGGETLSADIEVPRTINASITDGGEVLAADVDVPRTVSSSITDGGEIVAADVIRFWPPLERPENFRVTRTSDCTGATAMCDAVTDASHYQFYSYEIRGGRLLLSTETFNQESSPTHTYSSLDANTSYAFKVRAYDAVGPRTSPRTPPSFSPGCTELL